MKNILRIAWRDFQAITSTKAFWIGMALSPVIGLGFSLMARTIEDSRPTRNLILVDQTGGYRNIISQAINISDLRTLIPALRRHYAAYRETHASVQEESGSKQLEDWLNNYRSSEQTRIANEIERAGGREALIKAVRTALNDSAPPLKVPDPGYRLLDLPTSVDASQPAEALAEALRPYLEGDRTVETDAGKHSVYAAVVISEAADGDLPIRAAYWSKNLSNTSVSGFIQSTLNRELERRQLLANGIEPSVLRRIQATDLDIERFDISKAVDARESQVDVVLRIVPIAFAGLLMLVVMINIGLLLQSIIEEKSNRLLEILLSSVTPLQLMVGKLLGIAAVTALTLVSWIVIVGSFIFFSVDAQDVTQSAAGAQVAGVDPEMISAAVEIGTAVLKLFPVFIFYLACGYLIYASLILALGSLCTSQQEANSLTVPIILSLMLPLFVAPFILRDPGGTLATVFTWIPFFTPMVMLARFNSDPPLLDVLGSTVLLVVTVAVVVWVSVKIFRHGALHAQQPPKFWALLRLIVQKEN